VFRVDKDRPVFDVAGPEHLNTRIPEHPPHQPKE
jgi:hypothetical protein